MRKRKRDQVGDDGELIRDESEGKKEGGIPQGTATVIAALIALLGSILIQTPNAKGVPQPVLIVILQTIFNAQDIPTPTPTVIVQQPTETSIPIDTPDLAATIIAELTATAMSATSTPDIRGTVFAELTQTARAQPSNTPTVTYTPTLQTVGLPFADNFSGNDNSWTIGSSSAGAASLANGQLNIIAFPNRFLPFQVEIPGVRAGQFFAEADVTTTQNPDSTRCDSFQYVGYAFGDPQVEQYVFVVGLQWTVPFGLTNECLERKWYGKIFRVQEGEVEFFRIVNDREDYLSTTLFQRELTQNEIWQSDVPFRLGFERDASNLVSLYINGRQVLSQTIASPIIENRISFVIWAPRTFQNTQFHTNASAYIDNVSVDASRQD